MKNYRIGTLKIRATREQAKKLAKALNIMIIKEIVR